MKRLHSRPSKGDTPEYRAKLRSLFQNLKNKDNRELGQHVLSGDITPAKFVVMTHDELKSSKQVKEEKMFENENMKKAQVPMAEKSISDALRCGRCGQKKVSYSQAQTRSADEPMTTFCECTVCGNRWKVCFHNSNIKFYADNDKYSSLKHFTLVLFDLTQNLSILVYLCGCVWEFGGLHNDAKVDLIRQELIRQV